MAEPRAGERFTCTVGVAKTHFRRFLTDLWPMKIFENFRFFDIFHNFGIFSSFWHGKHLGRVSTGLNGALPEGGAARGAA